MRYYNAARPTQTNRNRRIRSHHREERTTDTQGGGIADVALKSKETRNAENEFTVEKLL